MVRKLFMAAAAVIGMASCSEKDVEFSDIPTGDKIQLTVQLTDGVTKVTGNATDAQVNNIQIFVFDKNGIFETSSNSDASSLSLTCTTGEKKIVALANAPLETGVTDINDLRARTSDLKDCTAGSIVMAGEISETLTTSSTVTMAVERLAAKVAVGQITTDFELEQHQHLPFTVKSIYLINVAGDKPYLSSGAPSLWYNKSKYVAETSPSFLYDAVTSGTIAPGETYNKEHYFYCYPNTTSTKTRLVIEAEIGGYTYYYPVTLNAVNANTSYTYNLTITRLGSNSPNVPVEDGTVVFTVTVKDWVQQNVNETI